jgi:hypothetical protein
MPKYTLLKTSLNFQAALVADLVHDRKFDDIQTWGRCIGVYMDAWLDEKRGTTFAESVRNHYLAIDRVRGPDFVRSQLVLTGVSRPIIPFRKVIAQKKAKCYVIRYFLWRTELCYSFLILLFASFEVDDMAF